MATQSRPIPYKYQSDAELLSRSTVPPTLPDMPQATSPSFSFTPSLCGPAFPSICTDDGWVINSFTESTLRHIFRSELGQRVDRLVQEELLDQAAVIHSPLGLYDPTLTPFPYKPWQNETAIFRRLFARYLRTDALGEVWEVTGTEHGFTAREGDCVSIWVNETERTGLVGVLKGGGLFHTWSWDTVVILGTAKRGHTTLIFPGKMYVPMAVRRIVFEVLGLPLRSPPAARQDMTAPMTFMKAITAAVERPTYPSTPSVGLRHYEQPGGKILQYTTFDEPYLIVLNTSARSSAFKVACHSYSARTLRFC